MRYIKVEDAIKVADKECGEFRGIFARIKERLEAIQTADVVERKTGRWNTDKESPEYATCSACGHCDWDCTESEYFKYCPNCGAQMDERREERRMTEVYRRVAIGQSGNEGVEYTKVAEFETEEEARDFCNKQTDTNGWVDYVVVCRDMDKER